MIVSDGCLNQLFGYESSDKGNMARVESLWQKFIKKKIINILFSK